MNNQNIFAVPFTPSRPFSLTQYVNEMFRLSTSIASNASTDDLRTLEAVAINVKTAHEYEVQASLAAAVHQLEELKAENAELRAAADQLNAERAANQDLRRRAKDVESQMKDKLNRKVAEEVARQTKEKDWKIERLNDQIQEFSNTDEKLRAVLNTFYKKNEEIKDLKRKVSNLIDWKDTYYKKCMERESCHPNDFTPAELVDEINKLDALNTILKCDNEEYREEIRGFKCLHGLMDKNWVEVKQENEEMKEKFEKMKFLFVQATASFNFLAKRSCSLDSAFPLI